MSANTTRYEIRPIADENCNSLADHVLATTRGYKAAKAIAESSDFGSFGVGILDTRTKLIDVGFGLGVPCPDFSK